MNKNTQPDQGPGSAQNAAPAQQHAPKKPAGPARFHRRHKVLLFSFAIWVFFPLAGIGAYLVVAAQDQYASYVGFAVRSEDTASPLDLLGGIAGLSRSSSSDTDILYKYISGRQMIRAVDATLDLRSIYTNPEDWVFSLRKDAGIEDIEAYWQRVVDVFYEPSSGLIDVRVVAFSPEDAHDVVVAIIDESTRLINQLAATARLDATRHAQEELGRTTDQLKLARQAMTSFRARTQIIDPLADTQGRMGLLSNLQTQLAEALINLDLLQLTRREDDPRTEQAERLVEVIRARIVAERKTFSDDQTGGSDSFSTLVGEYEALAVDQEFAEKSYLAALANYNSALAETRWTSRYLAVYIEPTLAESSQFPKRFTLFFLTVGALILSWAIAMLIYYSIRDRR